MPIAIILCILILLFVVILRTIQTVDKNKKQQHDDKLEIECMIEKLTKRFNESIMKIQEVEKAIKHLQDADRKKAGLSLTETLLNIKTQESLNVLIPKVFGEYPAELTEAIERKSGELLEAIMAVDFEHSGKQPFKTSKPYPDAEQSKTKTEVIDFYKQGE